MTLAYDRRGAGEPLLLLHALGASRHCWDPVTESLARSFDVIAVDLPGFGESQPLPAGADWSPAALAGVVATFLAELGVQRPHVVGNSLGGWIALELATQRHVASVTALAPAGLWRRKTPHYDRVSLRVTRLLARSQRPVAAWLMRFRIGRLVILGQSHGRPMHMTAAQARQAVNAMARCRGFRTAFRATLHRRFVGGQGIAAPVTVAFGTRDRILLRRQSRHLDELPAHTQLATLPRCGHLPMADDPAAVAEVIRATALSAAGGTVGEWSRQTTSA
jgi:pimeloyl-ACP methyl ester carboxylesterase